MEAEGAQFSIHGCTFNSRTKHLGQSEGEDKQNHGTLHDQANRVDRESHARGVGCLTMLLFPENPVDLESYLQGDHKQSINDQSDFTAAHAAFFRPLLSLAKRSVLLIGSHSASLVDPTEVSARFEQYESVPEHRDDRKTSLSQPEPLERLRPKPLRISLYHPDHQVGKLEHDCHEEH